MPELTFPMATLVYFQFVFAAITVIILAGSVLGRMSFRAWILFVPMWMTVSGASRTWILGFARARTAYQQSCGELASAGSKTRTKDARLQIGQICASFLFIRRSTTHSMFNGT